MAALVCHGGALGDFITTLPAIRVWRRQHPGGRLVLLGRPAHAALCPGLFDEAWDAQAARFASLFGGAPAAGLADAFGRFDHALVFSPVSSPFSAALSALGVHAVVRQDPFPPPAPGGQPVHIVDWHLSLFPPGEVRSEERIPRVDVPPAPDGEVAPGTVAVAPGSGSPSKNWPLPSWAALSACLAARGTPVAWIAGPAEQGMQVPGGLAGWKGLPLPALAGRLARAALYIGNDSGVSHLAAAVGCRSLVLFGPTDPGVWAPRGARVRVKRGAGGSLGAISVDEILAEAQELLEERRRTG
jgi:heptosyltransferase III